MCPFFCCKFKEDVIKILDGFGVDYVMSSY